MGNEEKVLLHWLQSYPDTLYATKYTNYDDSSEGSNVSDKNYFQPQITPQSSYWSDQRQREPDPSVGFVNPLPHPALVVADKWDPYDSEPDVPIDFRFEGHEHSLTPAGSLSSLASNHLVFFKHRAIVITTGNTNQVDQQIQVGKSQSNCPSGVTQQNSL
jgi:hypothetical protein